MQVIFQFKKGTAASQISFVKRQFLLIYDIFIYGTKYFYFYGTDVRSFLTLNGFLLAGLVLKKQREILNGSDVDDSEANK